MTCRRRDERGLSLLELLVALGIFLTVSVGMSELLLTSSDVYETGITLAALDGKARRAVDLMAGHLMAAGRQTLTPSAEAPFGSATMTFQKAEGWSAGAKEVVWGPVMRFSLEMDQGELPDGLDNDGDGLLDEQQLVMTLIQGGVPQQVPILGGVLALLEGETANGLDDNGNGLVDEAGLSFVMEGERMTIRLSVGGRGAGGRTLIRTVETTVLVRNE